MHKITLSYRKSYYKCIKPCNIIQNKCPTFLISVKQLFLSLNPIHIQNLTLIIWISATSENTKKVLCMLLIKVLTSNRKCICSLFGAWSWKCLVFLVNNWTLWILRKKEPQLVKSGRAPNPIPTTNVNSTERTTNIPNKYSHKITCIFLHT